MHYLEAQQPSPNALGFSTFQADAFSTLNHNSYGTSVQYLQLYTMQSKSYSMISLIV